VPIWNVVSEKKQQVTSVFKTSQPIPLDAFVAEIERRRAAAGYPDMPRNAGNRRTDSKRALLKAIEAAGGKW
jgi:hypothetical protein